MRALMLFAAIGLLGSCSRPVMPPASGFAEAVAGRVAGPPQTCITNNPAENLHVLDPQTLAYGYGRTIFINRLESVCPGLRENNTLIVRAGTGGEYCRGDQVSAREPGAFIPGPSCNLSYWVPYRLP